VRFGPAETCFVLARADGPVTGPVILIRPLARRLPSRRWLFAGFVGWALLLRRVAETTLG
jgi:hypothetical protein